MQGRCRCLPSTVHGQMTRSPPAAAPTAVPGWRDGTKAARTTAGLGSRITIGRERGRRWHQTIPPLWGAHHCSPMTLMIIQSGCHLRSRWSDRLGRWHVLHACHSIHSPPTLQGTFLPTSWSPPRLLSLSSVLSSLSLPFFPPFEHYPSLSLKNSSSIFVFYPLYPSLDFFTYSLKQVIFTFTNSFPPKFTHITQPFRYHLLIPQTTSK